MQAGEHGISVDEAFSLLRNHSQSNNIKLAEMCPCRRRGTHHDRPLIARDRRDPGDVSSIRAIQRRLGLELEL